jgi:hypothetical protein
MWDVIEELEDKLSEATNSKIRLSKESFYSGQERLFYKRLLRDDKKTGVRVDIMDLQGDRLRGKLDFKIKGILSMLSISQGE